MIRNHFGGYPTCSRVCVPLCWDNPPLVLHHHEIVERILEKRTSECDTSGKSSTAKAAKDPNFGMQIRMVSCVFELSWE